MISGLTSGTIVHNNSLVIMDHNFLQVICASGSMRRYIGQLIGLDGNDVTYVHDDSIYNIDSGVPGSILILIDPSFADQGVYTCRIPDENDVEVDVNIGFYPPGFNSEFHCTCSGCRCVKVDRCTCWYKKWSNY